MLHPDQHLKRQKNINSFSFFDFLKFFVFFSELISLPADLYCVITKFSTENLLYKKDCLKGLYIFVAEYMLKTPSYSLPGNAKGLMDILTVGAF